MGRLADELRDPWGAVVAGIAGGVSWAAAGVIAAGIPPVALGIGIGDRDYWGRGYGREVVRLPLHYRFRAASS